MYDGEGERLSTVRMARMPESKQLKTMVGAEVEAGWVSARTCNWSRLPTERTTTGRSSAACCPRASSSSTSSTPRASQRCLRCGLMECPQGGGAVREVSPSAALRRRRCRAGDSGIAPSAFEASRVRTYRASPGLLPQPSTPHGLCRGEGPRLPIGSGVVEATCKTLVTERLKRSGMRWSERGGQALTLRALLQSHRFESGWSLLLQTYRADVSAPDNVVPLRRPRIH